jgi:hypothetical protein
MRKKKVQGSIACHARSDHRKFRRLNEIISHYIRTFRKRAVDELRFYRARPSLGDAISKASLARTSRSLRHFHQRRIPEYILQRWNRELAANTGPLRKATSFGQLFRIVDSVGSKIDGVGPLTVYDTAHRIGAFLKLAPGKVYLHAGTRKGARVLGLASFRPALKPQELPEPFRRLKPYEIEDCLCIYKDLFARITRRW